MAEIRNLTRNGETFYPLTTTSAVINESTGESLVIDDVPTPNSDNLVKSGGIYSKLYEQNVDISDIFAKTKYLKNIPEEGLNIIDSSGNIGLNVIPKVVREQGLFLVDSKGNIGCSVINGKFSFVEDTENYLPVIKRINSNVREVRELYNEIDHSIPSLLAIEKTSEHVSRDRTFASIGQQGKRLVRVGLHYGQEIGMSANYGDIFFDETCEKDFSDVRFFDSDGNILNAVFGECVNMEPVFDDALNQAVLMLSDGTLVGYNEGVTLSTDAGQTWNTIPGTTERASHPSDVDLKYYMYPVFVDSNDNIYAYREGILYKLHSSDGYATISPVLDMTWNNDGTTVYPDLKDGAAEDIDGNIYIGPYQKAYHTSVFVSTDGGDTFSLAWASWDNAHSAEYLEHAQHVHHIHASPYSKDVYVGIDDGAVYWNGPIILKTSDGGNTWTDITIENHNVSGRDYYPTYFGDGTYKLGGGECYVLGGSTIIRSTDDENYESVMRGIGGVRSYSDFGDDSLIVTGVQCNDNTTASQLVYSKDKGKTWHTFFRKDVSPREHSGFNFRKILPVKTIRGEEEQSILFTHDVGFNAMKLYKGGNHYYREAYVLVEDKGSSFTITAKTGYMMPYPAKVLNGVETIKSIYSIPLNEGFGNYITDSLDNSKIVQGNWDKDETQRWSDYDGNYSNKPLLFSSGLKLDKAVNFGKISELSFNKNYTITFWLNEKDRLGKDYEPASRWDRIASIDGITYKILGFANLELYRMNRNFGIMKKENIHAGLSNRVSIQIYPATTRSEDYFFFAIVVKEGTIEVAINGGVLLTVTNVNTLDTLNDTNLSEADFYIGSDTNNMPGYISGVNVYNSALTEKEINAIYKGYYAY